MYNFEDLGFHMDLSPYQGYSQVICHNDHCLNKKDAQVSERVSQG